MKVLIADDDRLSRTILAETVARMGHEVVVAADGRQALALLETPDCGIRMAILDWTMPHLDGPEVCVRVRSRKTCDYVYLILVSARTKPESVLEGLEAGADDYVAKPFNPAEIHARVRAAERVLSYQDKLASFRAQLDEIIANLDCGILLSNTSGRVLFANGALALLAGLPEQHAVGQLREEVLAMHAVRANGGSPFLMKMLHAPDASTSFELELALPDLRVVRWTTKMIHLPEGRARLDLCRDVTAEVALSRILEQKATHDHLTGLLNRRGGDENVAREVSRSMRFRTPLGFLLVDIDHFKNVNDVCGHAMGDRVLAEVAKAIRGQLRAYDHAIRWGGEEILIVLPETSSFQAVRVAERIRASIAALKIEGGVAVTVSVGVAELLRNGPSPTDAISAADAALYRAKDSGRNCVKRAGEELATLPPPLRKSAHSNPPP